MGRIMMQCNEGFSNEGTEKVRGGSRGEEKLLQIFKEISKKRSEMSICSICRPIITARLADQRHVVPLFYAMHSIIILHSNARNNQI